ncbi:MAG: hypothetical protein D6753_01285 [Planctomycetota bacterium]|nr:MAG: hypothetical protein D6753_01285 [Planctomycetota bacterium]
MSDTDWKADLRGWTTALFWTCFFCAAASISWGQPPSQENGSQATVVAIAGQPFGVCVIELPIAMPTDGQPPNLGVDCQEGRVFYPAVSYKKATLPPPPPNIALGRPGGLLDRLRSRIREAAMRDAPPVGTVISFLFRGDAPFRVALRGSIEHEVQVIPVTGSKAQLAQLLARWWDAYGAQTRTLLELEDFPSLVHRYLVGMLAYRLELPHVDLSTKEKEKPEELDQPLETLELLAAIEPLHDRVLSDLLTKPFGEESADRSLPDAPHWARRQVVPVGEPDIEPLAQRVPQDCFYVRFGSFANFLWFRDLSERFGGDVAQAVLLRGFNYDSTGRMERMLASRMTTVARMFGGNIVNDMALIGTDLYVKEGAALGVLFHVTQPALFETTVQADRKTAAEQTPGAVLRELEIGGRRVSFLATPDNRVRSFYVRDGNYALVTTSRYLVERFVGVADGAPALAELESFRAARSWMPASNGYTMFAFFSPEFFYRLMSPEYQIELKRRLLAIAHLEVAEMASTAAENEGLRNDSIASLRIEGLVPAWFDHRPDGSRVLRAGQHWIDSMRGRRGSFIPIPDVPVTAVTAREAREYRKTAEFYESKWRDMDPICLGVRRFAHPVEGVETVAIEAHVSPFDPGKYGWLTRQLGSPSPVEVRLPDDDIASMQVHVQPQTILPGIWQASDDYHLFMGVKDLLPPAADELKGLFNVLRFLQSMPAYLGAWPKPDLVEQLPFGIGAALAQPDFNGYSRILGGLWRWQDDQFSLLSFNRQIIDSTIPHLLVQQSQDLAQLRLVVRDMQGTAFSRWVNDHWYQRAWRTSHANVALLNALNQQMGVAPRDCLEVAERLLDVKLQCPLGGTFEFRPEASGPGGGGWVSTAWENVAFDGRLRPIPPADYQAPWIPWYRGGRLHITQLSESLSMIAQLDLELPPVPEAEPSAPLPKLDLDLFSLPSRLFGSGSAQDAGDKPKSPERVKF